MVPASAQPLGRACLLHHNTEEGITQQGRAGPLAQVSSSSYKATNGIIMTSSSINHLPKALTYEFGD
jgi:hypothetical protein